MSLMVVEYLTLEDIAGDFTSAIEDEMLAKYKQGDKLVQAVEPDVLARVGAKNQKMLLEALSDMVGFGRSTLFKRLKVAKVFPPEHRRQVAPGGYWEHAAIAASAADLEKPDTFELAWKWLDRSIDNGWPTRALETAMEDARLRGELVDSPDEEPRLIFGLTNAPCRVLSADMPQDRPDEGDLILAIPMPRFVQVGKELKPGMEVLVSLAYRVEGKKP